MRVIIAGSRHIIDLDVAYEAVRESGFEIEEVVCGCAKGADELGLIWGTNNDIPVKRMPAQWKYGKSAGNQRNIEMARYAHEHGKGGLIALWDGKSRGTAHMIKVARMQGLKVFVKIVKE